MAVAAGRLSTLSTGAHRHLVAAEVGQVLAQAALAHEVADQPVQFVDVGDAGGVDQARVAGQPGTADGGHVVQVVRAVYADRVAFCHGETALAPGLETHWVGGHTDGLQVVRVHTRRGWVVLASDASHCYENIERQAPSPIVFHVGDMVAGWQRITRRWPAWRPDCRARSPACTRRRCGPHRECGGAHSRTAREPLRSRPQADPEAPHHAPFA